MEIDVTAWTTLAVRWLHLVAGVAWIGASFYFVWLDNSLRRSEAMRSDVAGELWAVHGGGFYHNMKFVAAPPEPPATLHWFKWEAYTTWLSGFALLVLVYYLHPDVYVVDPAKADLAPAAAIGICLASLFAGWVVYDFLCRSPLGRKQSVFGALLFVLLTAAAFGLTRLISDRAAFIHTGALIGTIMAGNVFFVIIPNQRKAVAAMLAGQTPHPELGAAAKQRSLHNNYLTLPALLTMISGHAPLLAGHHFNWLLLAGFSAASVAARHYFNCRHKGTDRPALLGAGAMLFIATAAFASVRPNAALTTGSAATDLAVREITQKHCISCHAAKPTNAAFPVAPAGLSLETLADVRLHAAAVRLQAVDQTLMPLGNATGMTEADRALLGAWLDRQSGSGE